ncbi:MAG: lactonase family protein [Acidobacteriia bacterium]|nr:lactonase family protein [Terriglobia bacterium]
MAVARISRKLAYGAMLAAGALLAGSLLSVSAHAQLNLVYVEINGANLHGNVVEGFSNDGTGKLTKLPHSPYPTKGFGVTGIQSDPQFDSDGEMIANSAGTLMFAVNGHSNSITVYNINTDGSMRPIVGSPFASGGQDPVSLALKENVLPNNVSILMAVNKASDPGQTGGVPGYTTFDVATTGVLTMNTGSTFNLPIGTSPAQVLPRPGKLVQFFAVEFMNDKLVTYQANASGILTEISEAIAPTATLGAVVEPGTQKAVFTGLPMSSQVGVFSYDTFGNLTLLNQVADTGSLICWLAENTAGTRLYTSESGSATVSVYDTTAPSKPTQLQHFSLAPGSIPAHLKLDPTGNFLYVVDRLGFLHVLTVSQVDGTLSEPNAPVSLHIPAGAVPMAVVTLMK